MIHPEFQLFAHLTRDCNDYQGPLFFNDSWWKNWEKQYNHDYNDHRLNFSTPKKIIRNEKRSNLWFELENPGSLENIRNKEDVIRWNRGAWDDYSRANSNFNSNPSDHRNRQLIDQISKLCHHLSFGQWPKCGLLSRHFQYLDSNFNENCQNIFKMKEYKFIMPKWTQWWRPKRGHNKI